MAQNNFTNKIAIDTCCSVEKAKQQPTAPVNKDPANSQIKNVAEEHEQGWKEHWEFISSISHISNSACTGIWFSNRNTKHSIAYY